MLPHMPLSGKNKCFEVLNIEVLPPLSKNHKQFTMERCRKVLPSIS
jgi:hypothetical protein